MRQIILSQRPEGRPRAVDFDLQHGPAPALPAGSVLAETLFVSIDPAMLGWISGKANYLDPVPLGAVMRSLGVARIVRSETPAWAPGDIVYGWTGWSGLCVMTPAQILWRVDPDLAPPQAWLSVLGLNGLTAIKGLTLAHPKAGETLLVTTAAGGVGSLVGQLGRRAGMRVVGVTGSAEKVRLARERFGYDDVIDYKAASDLGAAVKAACPNGINVFWDNVGGEQSDVIFDQLAIGARIIQCGTAGLADGRTITGPRRERAMIIKRLSWRGFIAFEGDEAADSEALSQLKALVKEGALDHAEEIMDGLDQAPHALARLFAGDNLGRICVRVTPEDRAGSAPP